MSADYTEVGRLKEIMYFPIKSCRGISVTEANCNVKGIDFDRHWVILDRGGRPVTLGSRNELALVVPTVSGDEIKIEAPGMEPLKIPLEISWEDLEYVDVELLGLAGSGVHVSKEADEWFSEYLKKPHTFVAFHSSCKPRYVRNHKKFGNMPYVRETDCTAFSNGCPYLMISEESLAALNRECTELHCDMKRLRPNLVIEGCKEFEEDTWKWIKIGSSVFRCLHKCGRCPIPNVDPFTGERHKTEPLTSMRKFRLAPKEEEELYRKNAPLFGRNLGIENPGVVNLGDVVYTCM